MIGILGSRNRTAANIYHAVRTNRLEYASLDILNIDIALDRDLGLIRCRFERSQIAPIVCALVFRIHTISPHGLHGKIAVDRDITRGTDGSICLDRRRIVSLGMNILNDNIPLDMDMTIRLRLDAVRCTRIRIRCLDGQCLFLTAVHNPNVLVVAAVNRTGNLVLTVRLNVQTMPVHIDNHRVLLIVRRVIRVETGDNATTLGIWRCRKCLTIIGQRLRFLNRVGRHLRLWRIDIAALPRRLIERDILNALTRGRGRQTLGDLRLTREIPLVRRICRVPELIRKRVERCAHEVLVCGFCRLRIESRAVRRQRDGTARRCVLDAEVAALDRRWRCGIMLVEYTCMAAVIINRDVLVVFLEDHARIVGIVAAP